MNEESRFMMQIWEAISDFIDSGDKQDAADALVESFVESGNDIETLYDADGECPYIDRALANATTEEEEDNGFPEEEW